MKTFRQAWSGVTGLLVIDPSITHMSRNNHAAAFGMLEEALPTMNWRQPRNLRRAVTITWSYIAPAFADKLAEKMGCAAERTILPPVRFVSDALKPPPLYFETDDRSVEGLCCVCLKKGCLGRCPNPSCGLLMHYSCVQPLVQGGDLVCPVCKT